MIGKDGEAGGFESEVIKMLLAAIKILLVHSTGLTKKDNLRR